MALERRGDKQGGCRQMVLRQNHSNSGSRVADVRQIRRRRLAIYSGDGA
jgi:hypothetical protein